VLAGCDKIKRPLDPRLDVDILGAKKLTGAGAGRGWRRS
jgi:hypothetical protein